IRTIRVAPADPSFNARYDAQWREYVYFLWFPRYTYPHLHGYSWALHRSWQDEPVRRACAYFEGTHDFSSFCRAMDLPENPVRTLYRVSFRRKGPLGWLRIRGNAFLTNMVRIMVGSLHEVGLGRKDPLWIKELLEEHRDRESAGRTAPPEGLFLWNVGYEKRLWSS
ncbi:MAG TPA: tRNA pseudouridine(38-40) synthase TruA, partial [Synergistaceae bacterium]|nr:tRNA pseudouridine(38-40) synthase TruA [Synergistaceae bacterium]